MSNWNVEPFLNGNTYVRADFHLHTKADKEFSFSGEEDRFVTDYINQLKKTHVRVGLITNHNKFDYSEFKGLKKKAKKEGILLIPGVELSVNDGANGVHTLIAFSDRWLEYGQDYINQFLSEAFSGKVPDQYEQENARCNFNLQQTLEKLETYHKDFFIIFAHVESPSGLWRELAGGRMQELGKNPLIKRHCKAFQKVRTHDKPDKPCRIKVKQWWPSFYPAEVEGSDPKTLDEIGRGKQVYLKIGELSFDAVNYALIDYVHRVEKDSFKPTHSFLESIRFEGGLFDGRKINLNPHMNCLIGIRGSGKSAILESLRYALDLPFGQESEDKKYKELLLPFILKSGGKVIVEAVDIHGTKYEIHRILNEQPDIYVEGNLRPGLSIRGTVITKPLYFGQKDLSASGKGFGSDLIDKLIGDQIDPIRNDIRKRSDDLRDSIESIQKIFEDNDKKKENESELKDIKFNLELFEKHGIEEKLSKQLSFDKDINFCSKIEEGTKKWASDISRNFEDVEELVKDIKEYETEYNKDFIDRYKAKCNRLLKTIRIARLISLCASKTGRDLDDLRKELEASKASFKDEFAEIYRELVKSLEEQGVQSVEPDKYIKLTKRKVELTESIESLSRKTERLEKAKEKLLENLTELNNSWLKEFRSISDALKIINDTQKSLKVEVTFKGDTKSFLSKMEEVFKGSGIRKDSYRNLVNEYSDFGAIYRDLENAASKTRSKSDIFKEIFLDNLANLLTFQIPNKYTVKYREKLLESHSLGQRASAMMLFILSQKENNLLLIDQPEDDLDNQTIYEDVVKLVRSLKTSQQFIFATHNANFPVLGDAENICACSFIGSEVTLESGSIDSKAMQKKIVAIMEGGKEAFDRRKMIYQTWKALGVGMED